ncbi:hypothetical protein [Paenibacillus ehimensis]|uniref:hypothetical protein n=1 Tax=Paenibacillus ehimensis TaxID=79264 RepID=UPI000561101D|nr:hypothetical protein [Paenibacillus ehimensis]
MELRSKLEDDDELKEAVLLKVGDTTVKWNDFFYETENFSKCYKYLLSKGDKTKYGFYSKHPICIKGHIQNTKDLTEKYSAFAIDLRAPHIKIENKMNVPAISLHTQNTDLIRQIEEYRTENGEYPEIAAYCIMRAKDPHNTSTKSYLNMKGNVYRTSQLIIIQNL